MNLAANLGMILFSEARSLAQLLKQSDFSPCLLTALLGSWRGTDSVSCLFKKLFLEDYFNSYLDPESFEDWADRIAQEYSQKRRGREERHSEQRQSSSKREQRKTSSKEEHLLFQKRARIKAEELKEAKRRRYEESCSQFFSNNSTHLLTYSDIPWPCPSGTPEEMAAVALHGNDCSDAAAYRRFIRRQQVLWHPDKFAQRCGTRLAERDRHRILETVTALSQAFNQLAAVAK